MEEAETGARARLAALRQERSRWFDRLLLWRRGRLVDRTERATEHGNDPAQRLVGQAAFTVFWHAPVMPSARGVKEHVLFGLGEEPAKAPAA